MKRWFSLKSVSIIICIGFVLVLSATNWWVIKSTENNVMTDTHLFPKRQVALVLGTSNKLKNGSANPYFENRIKVAADLYHEGKVSHFILSGDNRTRYYNEPLEMKKALMKRHVPARAITLDSAGLRTLDSILRSKEVFGQDNITIITQPFHSYRALFISRFYHINAMALVTQDVYNENQLLMYVRECFARTKAVLDLYVLKTSPEHLGKKRQLPL